MEEVFTPALERKVTLRPEPSSDRQVWADTFTGLYHVPPEISPPPATVLDLGANIGLTAAHYAELWPDAEIVAVEMDAQNCWLASINAPTVRIRQEAVWGRPGMGAYNRGARAEAFAFDPDAHPAVSGVQARTLRQIILRSFESGIADFVKMDVEGAEWSIFAHPTWAVQVRRLLVELHAPAGESSNELIVQAITRLQHFGYSARPHPPHPQAVYAERLVG